MKWQIENTDKEERENMGSIKPWNISKDTQNINKPENGLKFMISKQGSVFLKVCFEARQTERLQLP